MYSSEDLEVIQVIHEYGIMCSEEEALEIYDEIVGFGIK